MDHGLLAARAPVPVGLSERVDGPATDALTLPDSSAVVAPPTSPVPAGGTT